MVGSNAGRARSNSQAGWRMAQQRPNAPGLPACDARNEVEKGNKRRTQRSGERRNEVGRSTAETDRARTNRLCRSTKVKPSWLSIDTPLLKTKEGFFGQALLALDSPRFASALPGARIAAEPQSVVTPTATSLPMHSGCAGFYYPHLRKLQAYFFGSCVKLVTSGSCESTFFRVSGCSDHRIAA